MARNGSGTYIPPASTWNPAVDGTPILSADWNTLLADITLALTQSVASNGETTFSARIPFAQGLSLSNGSLASPSMAFISDTDTGFYRIGANHIGLSVGGVLVMEATTAGVAFTPPASFVNASFTGNATIGDAVGDTLTVNATSTFVGPITVPDASFTNAKLSNVPTATFKGRTTAGTGAPEDLTATQATAILNPLVGDSGAGGTKGLVPAPAAGDAAAAKFLRADATWVAQEVFAWAKINGSTGALIAGYNVASSTKDSSGTYSIVFTTNASNSDYGVNATAQIASASGTATASVNNTVPPATTGCQVRTHILTNVPTIAIGDVDVVHVTCYQ